MMKKNQNMDFIFYTSLPESSTRNKYVSARQKLQDSVKQGYKKKKKLYFWLIYGASYRTYIRVVSKLAVWLK